MRIKYLHGLGGVLVVAEELWYFLILKGSYPKMYWGAKITLPNNPRKRGWRAEETPILGERTNEAK